MEATYYSIDVFGEDLAFIKCPYCGYSVRLVSAQPGKLRRCDNCFRLFQEPSEE